jgi:hypothetical protein
MATVFTRQQISGTGPKQYGAKVQTHRWSSAFGADLYVSKIRIDFDALATATGVALAASDNFPLFDVRAGDTVLFCGFHITTAATGAADLDVGITGEANVAGFIDGIEANDTSPTVVAAPFGLHSGTTFSSADTVDAVEVGGASLAGCVAEFWMMFVRAGLQD